MMRPPPTTKRSAQRLPHTTLVRSSEDARNATTAATSSGRPARPIGVYPAALASSAVVDPVVIQPGATLFTVIPCWATSSARLMLIPTRSEEHTSVLQSLMRISYAVFCLKNKITHVTHPSLRH